ncbi:hypothetical protein [Sneathiella litorea]|uniref:DUF922 domain-containing protein n=1 Tax=Sneathiella litorea TaxID=2606216 RepID=A0A6L8W2T9_9PROT|nr:hypothetical protein [Sneathiella litorea]MZR29386.1 hypothetical protein [Sneathiella litorea]
MKCLIKANLDRAIYRKCLRALFAFIPVVFAWSGVVQASTDKECLATWQEPAVTIEIVNAKPALEHGKSSDQIERVAKKSGYAKSTRHASLLGLTSSIISPKLGAATKYKLIAPGEYCLRLDRVTLSFGVRKTDIYIDRKYHKGTCAYKAILDHELKHVRINEQLIAEYVPKIKRELKERAAGIQPYHTKNPKRAGRSIANRLLLELDPMLEEFNVVRMQANDVIDTQESYAATQAMCSDW